MQRTPKWWDRPLGAALVVVAVALVVLIMRGSSGTPANLSKHALGAVLVLAFLGTLGMGLAVPKYALRFVAVAFLLVPAAFAWVGIEHFVDWREFKTSGHGRHSVRTEGAARVEGVFLIVVGAVVLSIWIEAVRKKRRSGPRA